MTVIKVKVVNTKINVDLHPLMVFGPGNYTFGDFVKIGGVLTLALTVVAGVFVYYAV